eukprot:m.723326 g.723326  ORF g.723326 m.723326 type:complete len:231 (+) comp23019_c4_seq1:238-930(+)
MQMLQEDAYPTSAGSLAAIGAAVCQQPTPALGMITGAPIPATLEPTTEKKSRRVRSKTSAKSFRDPEKPKRVLPPFMFFSVAMRPKVQAEYPHLSFGDRAKKLSELWKNLSPQERKVYEDKTEQDKLRHAEEMRLYVPNPDLPKPRKRKRQRAEGEPKKPLPTYLLFARDVRAGLKAEHPNASVAEIARMIGEQWRNLSSDEAQAYRDRYAIDRENFMEKKEAFRQSRRL